MTSTCGGTAPLLLPDDFEARPLPFCAALLFSAELVIRSTVSLHESTPPSLTSFLVRLRFSQSSTGSSSTPVRFNPTLGGQVILAGEGGRWTSLCLPLLREEDVEGRLQTPSRTGSRTPTRRSLSGRLRS